MNTIAKPRPLIMTEYRKRAGEENDKRKERESGEEERYDEKIIHKHNCTML